MKTIYFEIPDEKEYRRIIKVKAITRLSWRKFIIHLIEKSKLDTK